jgi:hypothetical protein
MKSLNLVDFVADIFWAVLWDICSAKARVALSFSKAPASMMSDLIESLQESVKEPMMDKQRSPNPHRMTRRFRCGKSCSICRIAMASFNFLVRSPVLAI